MCGVEYGNASLLIAFLGKTMMSELSVNHKARQL